jgi:hypothetical protein
VVSREKEAAAVSLTTVRASAKLVRDAEHPVPSNTMIKALGIAAVCAVVSCGSSAPDPRYPAHEAGCPVKTFPGQPTVPVDDLGTVTIDCAHGGGGCERQALDVVCRRGGDVAWGLADNALTSTSLVVHAARVFVDAPPMKTENVGPVTALCAADDAKDVCLRELEDQVCRLGGDVVWQVDGPTPESTSNGNRQRMRGRAAHTR